MEKNAKETAICQICGRAKELAEVWPGDLVRGGIQETIKKQYPN